MAATRSVNYSPFGSSTGASRRLVRARTFLCQHNIMQPGRGVNGRFGHSVKYHCHSTEIVVMRNNGFYDGGYQDRRELRQAYEEWIAQTDVDLFVTLSLPENIGVDPPGPAFARSALPAGKRSQDCDWSCSPLSSSVPSSTNNSAPPGRGSVMELPGAHRSSRTSSCSSRNKGISSTPGRFATDM